MDINSVKILNFPKDFKDMVSEKLQRKSNLWYIFPIILGIIGGFISYFLTRHQEPDKAKECVIMGFIVSIFFHFFPMLGLMGIVSFNPSFYETYFG